MKIALSIAGYDPSAGAGILADIKVFSSMGVYGFGVTTAITAQNSTDLTVVSPISSSMVTRQLELLFADFHIDAIKIGMVSSKSNIVAISRFLRDIGFSGPIVLDPIIVSSTGASIMDPISVRTLIKEMIPISTVVTPNLREASVLCEMIIKDTESMMEAARRIHNMGARYVVVKGGHLKDEATDILYDGEEFIKISSKKISKEVHGTGCHFSAAIAANLASSMDIYESVRGAKSFIDELFARWIFKPGRGMYYFIDHR
jgi:hydroxymethylpyrimidine/phosphomethylpyrimidine kinase